MLEICSQCGHPHPCGLDLAYTYIQERHAIQIEIALMDIRKRFYRLTHHNPQS